MAKKSNRQVIIILLVVLAGFLIYNRTISREALATGDTYLYCNSDTDCIFPAKCGNVKSSCTNNQCKYSGGECTIQQIINYLLVLKTSVVSSPKRTALNNGEMMIKFNGDKLIAGHGFRSTIPNPLTSLPECQVARGEYLPSSRLGCYQTSVSWNDFDFSIRNGETIDLNNYVSVKYIMQGNGVFNGVKSARIEENDCDPQQIDFNYDWVKDGYCKINDDYLNTFEITFKNILDVTVERYNPIAILNRGIIIPIVIQNNLFDTTASGYIVNTRKLLRDVQLPTKTDIVPFDEGINLAYYTADTSELGKYQLEIVPFIKLMDNYDYTIKNIDISYYIVQENEAALVMVEQYELPKIISTTEVTQKKSMALVFFIMILLFLMIIILIFKKKARKNGV